MTILEAVAINGVAGTSAIGALGTKIEIDLLGVFTLSIVSTGAIQSLVGLSGTLTLNIAAHGAIPNANLKGTLSFAIGASGAVTSRWTGPDFVVAISDDVMVVSLREENMVGSFQSISPPEQTILVDELRTDVVITV